MPTHLHLQSSKNTSKLLWFAQLVFLFSFFLGGEADVDHMVDLDWSAVCVYTVRDKIM